MHIWYLIFVGVGSGGILRLVFKVFSPIESATNIDFATIFCFPVV